MDAVSAQVKLYNSNVETSTVHGNSQKNFKSLVKSHSARYSEIVIRSKQTKTKKCTYFSETNT